MSLIRAIELYARNAITLSGIVTDGYIQIFTLQNGEAHYDRNALYIAYALGRGYKIFIGGEHANPRECEEVPEKSI